MTKVCPMKVPSDSSKSQREKVMGPPNIELMVFIQLIPLSLFNESENNIVM